MQLILDFIRNTKEEQFQIDHQKQDKSILPDGNALKEGRTDRLFDFCLYFIAPHRLKPMDVAFIVQLSEEVVTIPICAKADCMTVDERTAFQQLIRLRLAASEALTYLFAVMQQSRDIHMP